ncbi:hypothetical protein BaRGS_00004487 [Batillaria attramentaria]|uniref:EGF-like domain-containing protein n=1 Tax=Batillaria attramentaria TaxID=370345 RepID=A0ABD0LYU1_9CAEN
MSSKSADKYVALDTRQVVLMIFLIPVVTSHPHCQCDAGFTGTYCDVDKDYCSSDPCRSKGTCVAEVTGGYSCHCQPDFLGLNCEQHVSGKCAENGESFCTCTVNGSPVKVSIPAPPSPHDGADSRDVIMGLVGLLVGWAVGSGAMTIYRCCCRGPCCLDGACVGAGRRGQGRWTGVRPASSASTVSSLDSLFGDSPTHGLTESSRPALSSAGSHDSKRPMNVYRAGFSDTILHQTARRKSAGTYASGHVDCQYRPTSSFQSGFCFIVTSVTNMAAATFMLLILSAQLFIASGQTDPAPEDTCSSDCTCSDTGGEESFSRHEGLAAAVGALSPLVLGGAGLGLYHLLKGAGSKLTSPSLPEGPGVPDLGSPRPSMSKRGSLPSYKDSPPSYHGLRRGSTPVSLFGEDDDLSFDNDWRSPTRPETTSSITNIHRPKPADPLNRWM